MRIADVNQDIPFVRKDNFRLIFGGIKDNSYDQNIKNWLKAGKIIALKRGLYIFKSYWDKCPNKDEYLRYLSAVVYSPSYVSKETVLAGYGMMTEAVYGISAVTDKIPRTFNSDIGVFGYSKIKNSLFCGFDERFFGQAKYFVASKSKALFDYLYFYKRRLRKPDAGNIDEMRINFQQMSPSDWRELEVYLESARSAKLDRIYKLIKELYAE
jgi:hypothetical protein